MPVACCSLLLPHGRPSSELSGIEVCRELDIQSFCALEQLCNLCWSHGFLEVRLMVTNVAQEVCRHAKTMHSPFSDLIRDGLARSAQLDTATSSVLQILKHVLLTPASTRYLADHSLAATMSDHLASPPIDSDAKRPLWRRVLKVEPTPDSPELALLMRLGFARHTAKQALALSMNDTDKAIHEAVHIHHKIIGYYPECPVCRREIGSVYGTEPNPILTNEMTGQGVNVKDAARVLAANGNDIKDAFDQLTHERHGLLDTSGTCHVCHRIREAKLGVYRGVQEMHNRRLWES